MALDFASYDVNGTTLREPKKLQFINIIDVHGADGGHLQFITPKLRLSMGVFAIDFDNTSKNRKGARTSDLANATKVTLPMSIDLPGYDPSLRTWTQHMDALDAHFKRVICENASKWFGKDAALITRNIDDLYNSPVKPATQYPAMFAPKVVLSDDKSILTCFFDENGTPIANPVEDIVPNCLARVRYEISGITQVASSNKFYVNVRALEVKTYPQPKGPYDDLDAHVPRVCTIMD